MAACPNQYRCTCASDAWTCQIVGGCLGMLACPAGPDAGADAA